MHGVSMCAILKSVTGPVYLFRRDHTVVIDGVSHRSFHEGNTTLLGVIVCHCNDIFRL